MINRLQGFYFNVYYRQGKVHCDADAISRLFRYTDNVEDTFAEADCGFSTVKESDIHTIKRRLSLMSAEEARNLQQLMHNDSDFSDPENPNNNQPAITSSLHLNTTESDNTIFFFFFKNIFL